MDYTDALVKMVQRASSTYVEGVPGLLGRDAFGPRNGVTCAVVLLAARGCPHEDACMHQAPKDPQDHAHWDAVEEPLELIQEEAYKEALVLLREILTADAKNPYALYYTGVALYETGELVPARDAYRACLRVAPKYLGARIHLCHVLRELGELREAIREGMAALADAPEDGDVLHAIGLVYYARGEWTSARKYLEAFLEKRPEFEVAVEVKRLLQEMGGAAPS